MRSGWAPLGTSLLCTFATLVACGGKSDSTTDGTSGSSGTSPAGGSTSSSAGNGGSSGDATNGGSDPRGGNAPRGGTGGSDVFIPDPGTAGGGAFGGESPGAGGRAGAGQAGAGRANAGQAGTAQCGPCPGVACGPPFTASVVAESSGGMIAGLTATGTGGLEVTCVPNGQDPCNWLCEAPYVPLPGGDYSVTFFAPGYESVTVNFNIGPPPAECGCCGCPCPGVHREMVALVATEDDAPTCCAALDSDPANCGTCNHACPSSSDCIAGECVACLPDGASCGIDGAPCCNEGAPAKCCLGTCLREFVCVD